MAGVPVSGFDPIFWFHHSNVDRLIAMWQTLNSEKFFDDAWSGDPKPTEPLRPFHMDTAGTPWTSLAARSWFGFGYTYDDLPDPKYYTDTEGKKTIKLINDEYLRAFEEDLRIKYPSAGEKLKENSFLLDAEGDIYDYFISVLYHRTVIGGRTYSIQFYITDEVETKEQKEAGKSRIEPNSDFASHPGYLGQVYTFSAPTRDGQGEITCGNCVQQESDKKLSRALIPVVLPLRRCFRTMRDKDPNDNSSPFLDIPTQTLDQLKPSSKLTTFFKNQIEVHFVELGGQRIEPRHFKKTQVILLSGKAKYTPDDGIGTTYQDNYEIAAKLIGPDVTNWDGSTFEGELKLVSDSNARARRAAART